MEAFFGMITSAREEILITTPYFIPDESIFNALKITSKSGVNIKLIIPEKTDIKTAFYASQTYLKDLLTQWRGSLFLYQRNDAFQNHDH